MSILLPPSRPLPPPSSFEQIAPLLEEFKNRWNWQQAEWVSLARPLTFDFYQEWIAAGLHGEMDYLRRHQPMKENPQTLLAEARSILIMTKSYVPHYKAHGKLSGLRQAAYAQNEDYHDILGAELNSACEELRARFPGHHFRPGTDSIPVLERDFGRKAGLGWIGKNTCLIHPKKGSFFLIGEILTTLPVENQPAAIPDFCGTCTRCLDICPTKALVEPRKLDATKCISYWSIESKKTPPIELADNFGDWFFGCDLCQSVCPWNQKPFRGEAALNTELIQSQANEQDLLRDLRLCLEGTDSDLLKDVKGSPLARAKVFGLRRNAIIVAANRQIRELRPAIAHYLNEERLGELATWAVSKIDSKLESRP